MNDNNPVIHTDIEPGVISTQMIKDALREQGPKGEAGRLMEEESQDIQNTPSKQLRLEFLNILQIDHLWMMTGLTKLKLSNNIIEKIENLDELVNLVELDLSFNRITVIENLGNLVNLEILTLFENSIEEVQNLDSQTKLEIFSIGHNKISNPDCVLYLRKFESLKVLNMAGNPCCYGINFRGRISVFIPQLIYYEYKVIMKEERESIRAVFGRELEILEENEKKERIEKEKKEACDQELKFHKEGFVEFLDKDQLFYELFQNDAEGKASFLTESEAELIHEGFKEHMGKVTHALFNMGMEQLKLRNEEERQFQDTVNRTKKESLNDSRSIVEGCLERKEFIYHDTNKCFESIEKQGVTDDNFAYYTELMRNNTEDIHNLYFDVWIALMKNELTLYEQMEELITTFERNLADMINVFLESAQAYFTQIREQESTFMELITDHLIRFQTQASIRNDSFSDFPLEFRNMMVDKESVHSAMAASHDIHLLVIDGREDLMTSRIRQWHSQLCSKLMNDEIKRNRAAITEINYFLDYQRAEFEGFYSKYNDEEETILDTLSEKSINQSGQFE
ncbi:dynein regulatory complex subunit 3-like [Lycorma delicatula]|uniref:dynein regulatory complex subunit 3-like n=1 Tax=Lycorma delicatula TaxID=130591 RepID=UPI003F512F52